MNAEAGADKRANRILLGVLIALIVALVPLLYLLYLKRTAEPVTYAVLFPESPRALELIAKRVSPDRVKRGKKLARRHCKTCHLTPPPDVLPRRTWVPALRNMAARMGLAKKIRRLSKEEYGLLRDLKRAGILPAPGLSPAEFRDIAHYYYARAPKEPRPRAARSKPKMGAPFRVRSVLPEKPNALHDITLVNIDAARKRIFVGTLITPRTPEVAGAGGPPEHVSRLDEYSNRLRRLGGVKFDSPPVHMRKTKGGWLLTTLGGPPFGPGRILAERAKNGRGGTAGEVFGAWRTILKKSYRLTHARRADLDGDGRDDLLVSGFGFNDGALAWHDARGKEHVLSGASGAVRAEIRDFNGDGRPDVLALMAQAREGVFLHVNQGEGRFRPRVLLEQHPAFGYTHLELADLNGDGAPDLITTNGDNGDFPNPPLKYFHGVRVYLNQSSRNAAPRYKESWFYPLYGAYKVIARDFDLDGDQDLAVIALYYDAKPRPRENFVYFENTGTPAAPRFRPLLAAGLRDMVPGVMAAGDLDGDGDADLVLGALRYLSNPTLSESERRRARKDGAAPPMLMVLENRSR